MSREKALLDEARSFIVGSNLENSFVKQLDNKSLEDVAVKWLGL